METITTTRKVIQFVAGIIISIIFVVISSQLFFAATYYSLFSITYVAISVGIYFLLRLRWKYFAIGFLIPAAFLIFIPVLLFLIIKLFGGLPVIIG